MFEIGKGALTIDSKQADYSVGVQKVKFGIGLKSCTFVQWRRYSSNSSKFLPIKVYSNAEVDRVLILEEIKINQVFIADLTSRTIKAT